MVGNCLFLRMVNKYFVLFLMLLSSAFYFVNAQENIYDEDYTMKNKYQWAIEKKSEAPDESYKLLEECYLYFQQELDSVSLINCLFKMSDISLQNLDYALSFDHSCEALFIAEAIKDFPSQSVAHRRLAFVYSYYGLEEISMSHTEKALEASKMVSYTGIYPNIQFGISSYNLASKKRILGEPEEALAIMDSVHIDSLFEDNVPWFIADYHLELAKIRVDLRDFKEAEEHLEKAQNSNSNRDLVIMVSVDKLRGDIALLQGKKNEAVSLYIKALNFSQQNGLDKGLEAEMRLQLAKIYSESSQYRRAFEELSTATKINNEIQKKRIESSSHIFNISNKYQSSVLEKQATIVYKDKIIESKINTQFRLTLIIALLILLIIASAVMLLMRTRLRKTIQEKYDAEQETIAERERSEVEVTTKNKELASFALQLIDKENSLQELLATIKEISPADYKKLKSKYAMNNQGLWDEFNIRFTEVNKGFYQRLIQQYPDLSRTEQKHCAFIKLNFSTKEISHILNVEAQTINMSRSRIRKKMSLDRAESLSSVIGRI